MTNETGFRRMTLNRTLAAFALSTLFAATASAAPSKHHLVVAAGDATKAEKPAETKPVEAKPSETKPAEAKPAEGEAKPGDKSVKKTKKSPKKTESKTEGAAPAEAPAK
jgi:hypothetical protein